MIPGRREIIRLLRKADSGDIAAIATLQGLAAQNPALGGLVGREANRRASNRPARSGATLKAIANQQPNVQIGVHAQARVDRATRQGRLRNTEVAVGGGNSGTLAPGIDLAGRSDVFVANPGPFNVGGQRPMAELFGAGSLLNSFSAPSSAAGGAVQSGGGGGGFLDFLGDAAQTAATVVGAASNIAGNVQNFGQTQTGLVPSSTRPFPGPGNNLFGQPGSGFPSGGIVSPFEMDIPGVDFTPQGSSALFSPFSRTPAGARPQVHIQTNPVTGRLTWFRPAGRPILFSGDLGACKRVNKIARRARRSRGGR